MQWVARTEASLASAAAAELELQSLIVIKEESMQERLVKSK